MEEVGEDLEGYTVMGGDLTWDGEHTIGYRGCAVELCI